MSGEEPPNGAARSIEVKFQKNNHCCVAIWQEDGEQRRFQTTANAANGSTEEAMRILEKVVGHYQAGASREEALSYRNRLYEECGGKGVKKGQKRPLDQAGKGPGSALKEEAPAKLMKEERTSKLEEENKALRAELAQLRAMAENDALRAQLQQLRVAAALATSSSSSSTAVPTFSSIAAPKASNTAAPKAASPVPKAGSSAAAPKAKGSSVAPAQPAAKARKTEAVPVGASPEQPISQQPAPEERSPAAKATPKKSGAKAASVAAEAASPGKGRGRGRGRGKQAAKATAPAAAALRPRLLGFDEPKPPGKKEVADKKDKEEDEGEEEAPSSSTALGEIPVAMLVRRLASQDPLPEPVAQNATEPAKGPFATAIRGLANWHTLRGEALKKYLLKESELQNEAPEASQAELAPKLAPYGTLHIRNVNYHGNNRQELWKDLKNQAPKLHALTSALEKAAEKALVVVMLDEQFRAILDLLQRSGKKGGYKVATLEEVADFNKGKNLRGEKHRVLVARASQLLPDVRLWHVRRVHLLGCPESFEELERFTTGCCAGEGSHAELPPAERTLAVELHLARRPKALATGLGSLIYRELLASSNANSMDALAIEAAQASCLKALKKRGARNLVEARALLQEAPEGGAKLEELLVETALEQLGSTNKAPARFLGVALGRLRNGDEDVAMLERCLASGLRMADELQLERLVAEGTAAFAGRAQALRDAQDEQVASCFVSAFLRRDQAAAAVQEPAEPVGLHF